MTARHQSNRSGQNEGQAAPAQYRQPPGRYRNAIPNMIRALDGVDGSIRIFGSAATV